ncbi:16S rRNA (uracil(1498)-N(3))-methyltransferase [Bifidobacterium aemilianum]|uniref:Ribosomal RNA small subunit methyltransferase E n=1 Tax=Bifidobacterium aemilianum TaxID=2493120 RepID=A0A366K9A9_9BIFI|nr:16S rRNA (uracil(1498)-N(3))-methyltransferase [Bifidobacterium aemilianum]RBP98325.1 16S rRNA (uracil(1498)-N(3))-methyltransferase [Bifidobacterium aemilianum]
MTDPLFLLDTDHEDTPVNYDELDTGWKLTLPKSVSRHAISAMRLEPGDRLQLSDGRGLRIHACLTDKATAQAEVVRFSKEAQPTLRLSLIQALAKSGHDQQAIDAATQIGVDSVIPWQADRSIAKWKPGKSQGHWQQTLRAASEQSRRAWVPQLEDCINSKGVLAVCRRACVHGDMVVVLHQDAACSWKDIEEGVAAMAEHCLDDGRPRTINLLVGPEGGISDQEIELFTGAGAMVCQLGDNIMRASLAGPVALSLLSRALGRFGRVS